MPYIKQEDRAQMDDVVSKMIRCKAEPDGRLNYVLFKLCYHGVVPSYRNYKNFIGELNECVAEIRRRLLAPYEDKKIIDNGDVL